MNTPAQGGNISPYSIRQQIWVPTDQPVGREETFMNAKIPDS